jgi:asparagine synthase (glutamine-hydrolysing)
MSVQFGICNFDGKPVDRLELDRVVPVLKPYGPHAQGIFYQKNVGIIYRAFHTTKEATLEHQPHVSLSGAVITWDGRLDNRSDLVRELGNELSTDSSDVSIVAAAYQHWGTQCMSRLIGDWALSVFDPGEESLILARDPIGTRPLYYFTDKEQTRWSTILDPLTLFAGKSFTLSEEYVAGWLAFFPAAHLTPYVGIYSVPPSSFVWLRSAGQSQRKYWDFDPGKRIHYRVDEEYEEHFRAVFQESVHRRLRSHTPILAELSGGMDSSAIVCVADGLIASGAAEACRLDTLSYYNDSEPNWNERPYFERVEAKRGRIGCHINVGEYEFPIFDPESGGFMASPGSNRVREEGPDPFADCMKSNGNRVLLSGIGGDEVAGGVPTPIPELQDLLVSGNAVKLGEQLYAWALTKRKPWIMLFLETVRGFFPPTLVGVPRHLHAPAWLEANFVRRQRAALAGYPRRQRLFAPRPSFQENISTLDALRRQLTCSPPSSNPCCEKRYPYLDRGLLEFLYAIPREQLVRPGQRRSLMRRALAGIVPQELLNRKRKAFVVRSPMKAIARESAYLIEIGRHMLASSMGIVDQNAFCQAIQLACQRKELPVVAMIRTLAMEHWLLGIKQSYVVTNMSADCQKDVGLSMRSDDLPRFSARKNRMHTIASSLAPNDVHGSTEANTSSLDSKL